MAAVKLVKQQVIYRGRRQINRQTIILNVVDTIFTGL
jgi:hypothetical protein